MKRKNSVVVSILLCCVMLVGLLPTTAFAKSGTGTQQDPVIVSTFAELKEALEEDKDTWIVVNQFNNGSYYTLISGDDYTQTSLDQSAYACGAINIPTGKNKHLTINTTIDCRTATTQSGSLLYSFINNRGNLTIDGTGTLAVSFNAGNYANAIIFNQGELNIDAPITLDATCKTVQTFGRAILNHTGTFNISDGTYIGFKSKYLGTSGNVGAIYNSNTDDNDQSVISGGLFDMFYEDGRLNLSYALLNGGVDNLTLKGGTFYGIYASQYSLKLSALLGTSCRYTYENGGGEYDGSDASETTAALVVENNNLIPTVELTVTTPVAGNNPVGPAVDTFYVTIYAYEWYKGNDKITLSDTFEGGQNYTLKVRANTTKEFPNDVVVKVNGENATVLTVDNNNMSVLFEKSFTVPVSGYTLSFDASGGSGSMAPLTNAMSYTLPDCTFTAPSGKQFAGWNVFGSIYDVGDIVYLFANTTAYAEWEDVQPSGYTLTFEANGGSGSMAPLTGETSYTLPDCTFTAPSGKQFAGWNIFGYTQEAGNTVNLSSNMTAQAVWENIPQQDQPITAVDISCSGYVVGGNIAEAAPATSSTGVAIASYEWQDNDGTKLTSGTFAADTQYRLKVFLNVTDGYTANSLEKANVKINGAETTYITNPCVGVDAQHGDIMIYHYPARLTAPQPNEYMVSYNANGGSGTMTGDVVEENGTFTLENCTYTAPEGCRFKAWAIGGVNGEQKQPGEQITITAETYIYAVWEKVVTFGWAGNVCTVSLQTADAENFILAAGYENGQLVGCAFLDTIQQMQASFTCDQVRVFCVGKTAYGPACDPIPSVKP
ncbi:MAG: InlB B-repeat-containing protein [Clostridia bacterium]|nr:InlB B-repeat-containing protein [Clostridia bacterium]